jgi:hypothetical protein
MPVIALRKLISIIVIGLVKQAKPSIFDTGKISSSSRMSSIDDDQFMNSDESITAQSKTYYEPLSHKHNMKLIKTRQPNPSPHKIEYNY